MNLQLLRFDARDPLDFGLGHGIAETDPFVGGGIHDGTGPSGSTEVNILKFQFFNYAGQ